jgi:hypothetical protein
MSIVLILISLGELLLDEESQPSSIGLMAASFQDRIHSTTIHHK